MIKAIELNRKYLSTVKPLFTTSTLPANPELPRLFPFPQSGFYCNGFTHWDKLTLLICDQTFKQKAEKITKQKSFSVKHVRSTTLMIQL